MVADKSYTERLADWQRGKYAPPPEAELTPAEPSMIEMMPMRDGVRLHTEIFFPEDYEPGISTPLPVILNRSPYPFSRPSRNDKRPISRYLEAGYAFVFQMVRGQHFSEGTFHWHQPDQEDGYDCINWIDEQPWCDGNLGMEGASYAGKVQVQAAQTKPKALKCIMPSALIGNFVSNFPFFGGVPGRGWWLQWHTVADAESTADLPAVYGDMSVLDHPVWGPALRKRPLIEAAGEVLSGDMLASWRETMSHPTDDEFWRPAHSTDEELAELELPMFYTDGWYDQTVGPIDFFTRLERLRPDRKDRFLLVGPWNHFQAGSSLTHDKDLGERKMPANGGVDLLAQRLAFFDCYLRGNTAAEIQKDRVQVFITGLDEWRYYPTFPAPGTKERNLYLHSQGNASAFPEGGLLDWNPPGEEPLDTYIYDPELATRSPLASLAEPVQDFREMEIRGDVLTYTTEPLRETLTILGEIKLVLHAASDGLDTDWFATLTEVFPDGRSIPFHRCIGALRARYREGFDKEVFLVPNEPTEFCIAMGHAGHQLAPDSRLRLSICSAYFPECDPNTNTGNPALTDTEVRVAKQTIFHDQGRPSHVVIPVIDSDIN